MKILLIQPALQLRPVDSEFKRFMAPPLGLVTLAAATPSGHDIRIHDENIDGCLNAEDVEADLVGITVNVETAGRAYAIARSFRKRSVKVVLGGIHASVLPQEARHEADAVCIGEGAPVWPTIVSDAAFGRLQSYYRSEADPLCYVAPVPAWNLIRSEAYLYSSIITASRGCPFMCEFCYNSSPNVDSRYRKKDLKAIENEIRALKTRHVMFVDDNLIGDPRWTRELLSLLRRLRVRWNAAVSANLVSDIPLMDEMAASGCRSLFIGFETLMAPALQNVGKYQNRTDRYERLIALLRERGIAVNASVVFGFDGEDVASVEQTVDWLIRNRVFSMTAHILTPYPGTRLYERYQTDGRILSMDWSRFNTANVVFRPAGMRADELHMAYLDSYRRFYSLASIWRRLPRGWNQSIPYLLFNLGYRRLHRPLARFGRLLHMRRLGRLARLFSYGVM